MPYTTPPTFTPGTELAAADLNLLSDDIVYLKAQTDLTVFSGVITTRSATPQSIPNNSTTNVVFLSETVDQGGWIAVSSDTITVPAGAIPPGYTSVILDVRYIASWASNATGVRSVQFTFNGTPFLGTSYSAASANTTEHAASWKIVAEAGDTLTLEVLQTSGGALNLTSVSVSVDVYRPFS
jgi:hypothetical protein